MQAPYLSFSRLHFNFLFRQDLQEIEWVLGLNCRVFSNEGLIDIPELTGVGTAIPDMDVKDMLFKMTEKLSFKVCELSLGS
jgi:hypothetical protein